MPSPIVLLPSIGTLCWLVAGFLTFGSPIFWVWLLESVGLAVTGWLLVYQINH